MSVKNIGETPVDIYRAPAYGQSGPHFVIKNNDQAETVYYSDMPGTIDAQSSQILPRETETFDGSRDVWLSTLSDTVNVSVDVKFGSHSYSSGYVPSGLTAVVLDLAALFDIPAGSSVIPGNQIIDMIAYPSFDMQISAWCQTQTATGAALTLHCILQWFSDPAGTDLVWQEETDIWLADYGLNASPAYASGMNHGRYFRLILVNPGTTTVTVVNVIIHGTSRTYADSSSVWRQIPPYANMQSGITLLAVPPVLQVSGILSSIISVTVPASSIVWLPIPLWRGRVTGYFISGQVLAHSVYLCVATMLKHGDLQAGANSPYPLVGFANTAGVSTAVDTELPNMPAYIVVQTTTSSSAVTFVMTGSS